MVSIPLCYHGFLGTFEVVGLGISEASTVSLTASISVW